MSDPIPLRELVDTTVPQYHLSAYGLNNVLYKSEEDDEERVLVVAGYSSPQIKDREGHLITREALAKDLPRFLAHPEYRNANLLHSNITVGKVLPSWTNPKTGETYQTKVDDIGLFTVVQIRTDSARPPIMDRVEADILNGKLASFSISADAPFEARHQECVNGSCFTVISEISLYEITLAMVPGTMVSMGDNTHRPIEDVAAGEYVYTHRTRKKKVTQTGQIWYEGEIVKITTEDGREILLSPEHRVRVNRVKRAEWMLPTDLQVGMNIVEGDNRSGGIKTPEGRARQIASTKTDSFREKGMESVEARKKISELFKNLWNG